MTADSRNSALPPDRLKKLQEVPRLHEEAQTIEYMTQAYCSHFHGSKPGELCEECQAFLDYAKKRLACCPYGADKPVCAKCRIHCYKPEQKETAREIMRWAGPRLLFTHPILTLRHLLVHSRIPAPEKPRNTRGRDADSSPASGRKPQS